MVRDPEIPVGAISRQISFLIASSIKFTAAGGSGHYRIPRQRVKDQIKAYRELQRTLVEAESSSKRDVLNLDGPKFRFVFTEIIKFFGKALKDAGTDQHVAQNIMLQFGDLVKANDDNLRRDLNKIYGR